MKLNETQLKEATKLLKRIVVMTKKIDPDVVASAVVGMSARMCFVAASGDMKSALEYAGNLHLDTQTMVFNLKAAHDIELEQKAKRHETN
jgi:hypothetical protein